MKWFTNEIGLIVIMSAGLSTVTTAKVFLNLINYAVKKCVCRSSRKKDVT